jgi:hypothetical protein
LKILHLTNHLNTGGITTYIRTLAVEQVKAGHDVFVWGARGIYSNDLKAAGITALEDVPRCKSELSPRLWLALPKLVNILKTQSIDIIHAHTRVTQVLAAGATFFVKIPYVSTAHMFYKRRLGRRLFPCWGKTIIAISKAMEEGLRTIFKEKGLPPIVVVPNGIEVEKLLAKFNKVDRSKAREAYGYRKEDLVVLSLCRLIPVKGIHILIEAFAMACREAPEIKLLIAGAGDPDYVQKLKARVSELGLGKRFFLLEMNPRLKNRCVPGIFLQRRISGRKLLDSPCWKPWPWGYPWWDRSQGVLWSFWGTGNMVCSSTGKISRILPHASFNMQKICHCVPGWGRRPVRLRSNILHSGCVNLLMQFIKRFWRARYEEIHSNPCLSLSRSQAVPE